MAEPQDKDTNSQRDLEKVAKWLAWLGAGILLLGVGYLLNIAHLYRYLTPGNITILGALSSIALITVGSIATNKPRWFGETLIGAGIATAYLTGYGAYARYGLLDKPLAFASLITASILAFVLAVKRTSPVLGAFAAAGAIATPWILDLPHTGHATLGIYLIAIFAVSSALYISRGWRGMLLVVASGGLFTLYFGATTATPQLSIDNWAISAAIVFWALSLWLAPLLRVINLRRVGSPTTILGSAWLAQTPGWLIQATDAVKQAQVYGAVASFGGVWLMITLWHPALRSTALYTFCAALIVGAAWTILKLYKKPSTEEFAKAQIPVISILLFYSIIFGLTPHLGLFAASLLSCLLGFLAKGRDKDFNTYLAWLALLGTTVWAALGADLEASRQVAVSLLHAPSYILPNQLLWYALEVQAILVMLPGALKSTTLYKNKVWIYLAIALIWIAYRLAIYQNLGITFSICLLASCAAVAFIPWTFNIKTKPWITQVQAVPHHLMDRTTTTYSYLNLRELYLEKWTKSRRFSYISSFCALISGDALFENNPWGSSLTTGLLTGLFATTSILIAASYLRRQTVYLEARQDTDHADYGLEETAQAIISKRAQGSLTKQYILFALLAFVASFPTATWILKHLPWKASDIILALSFLMALFALFPYISKLIFKPLEGVATSLYQSLGIDKGLPTNLLNTFITLAGLSYGLNNPENSWNTTFFWILPLAAIASAAPLLRGDGHRPFDNWRIFLAVSGAMGWSFLYLESSLYGAYVGGIWLLSGLALAIFGLKQDRLKSIRVGGVIAVAGAIRTGALIWDTGLLGRALLFVLIGIGLLFGAYTLLGSTKDQ